MKKLLLGLTVVFGSTVFTVGQQVIGLTANFGVSKLTTEALRSDVTEQKFYFVPSGHAGLFYSYHFKDKYSITTGIYYLQIEGKEHALAPETDNFGNPNGLYMTFDTWRHIFYWSIPLSFGYDYKKINFNLGLQLNMVQESSARYKTEYPDPTNGTIITSDNTADNLPIDNYDFGLRAGLLYNLTKKLSLETTYYFGLSNIFPNNDFKWTVQQATVGLRYNLFSHGGQTTTPTEIK